MKEENIQERINKITTITRNFSIVKCPESIFEKFTSLAKKEFKDDYSMTLKGLLDMRKVQEELICIHKVINDMQFQIEANKEILRDLINQNNSEQKENNKDKIKTFGGK